MAEDWPLVWGEEGSDVVAEATWGGGGGVEVAITRNVVRSKRTTSVALHAEASLARWRDRTDALGMSICTILDHA